MNRSDTKPQSIGSPPVGVRPDDQYGPEGCAGAELCPSKPLRAPEAGSSVYSETGLSWTGAMFALSYTK